MKTYLYIALMLFFASNVLGQTEQPISVFLSNGDSISGELKGDLFTRPDLKIVTSDKTSRIQKNKVDSLILNNRKYYTHKSFLTTNLITNIEKGTIPIFEVNNNLIGVSRNDNLHIISTKNYSKALYLFSVNHNEIHRKVEKEEFISKITAANREMDKDQAIPFDSIINVSKLFLTRLSFLRPEIGIEIKIMKPISLYNSFGINFYGNIVRDAQTFINYDYTSEIRYYYLQRKRSNKGKSNYNFSGPFFAGTYKYLIDTNTKNKNIVGLLHGWQETNLFNNTYGGFRIGAGYDLTSENIMLISMLNIGWTF
jgi:hypothetical protein